MYNPQDTSGVIQAAIKNLVSNTVFYFSIPLTMDVVFAAGAGMEVTALVAAWKGFDESTEVSVLLNGKVANLLTLCYAMLCYATG
jgi:hypothetical protein